MTLNKNDLAEVRSKIKEAIDKVVSKMTAWNVNELDDMLVELIGLTEPLIMHKEDQAYKLNKYQELKMTECKPVNATEVLVRANPLFNEILQAGAQLGIADKLIRTMQNRQYSMALKIKKGIDE